MTVNPYGRFRSAIHNSCYLKPTQQRPTVTAASSVAPSEKIGLLQAGNIHEFLRAGVSSAGFPCTMGRAVFEGGRYRFGVYPTMSRDDSLYGLAHDLWQFVDDQAEIAAAAGDASKPVSRFSTFIAAFQRPFPTDEHQFEAQLWDVLQWLHERDVEQGYAWDPKSCADPSDPKFSFSFRERSFFIVGLYTDSSRLSRRGTIRPALTFNAKWQFDDLRAHGIFEKVQKTIRRNDSVFQGHTNPNLTNFGEDSEAKQYSGRAVEPDWTAPFHPRSG